MTRDAARCRDLIRKPFVLYEALLGADDEALASVAEALSRALTARVRRPLLEAALSEGEGHRAR